MNPFKFRRILYLSLALLSVPAAAQEADESVLDKLGPSAAANANLRPGEGDLQNAMRRIAIRPDDADALADAGSASLTLGDPHAALNFFTRANGIRPNTGRIVAGLAVATVRTENPFEALRLFDDAVKLGVSERTIAADRALAFDLLGNFARAQQDYQLARTNGPPSDDLIIHQVVSLSLQGKANDADGMLVPLLQRNVSDAWRARAFMLAARGDYREATKVAQGFMDADAASRMERYFRLIPDLTPAQKSAAIHLGHFPASYDIGHDSEQVRELAATIPAPVGAQGEARLIPSGVPLGTKIDKKSNDKIAKKDAKAVEAKPVKVATLEVPTKKGKPDKKLPPLSTDAARNAVKDATGAKVAVIQNGKLPAPTNARPSVTINLPTEKVEGAPNVAAADPFTIAPPVPSSPPIQTIEPDQLPASNSAEADVKVAASDPLETAGPISLLPETEPLIGKNGDVQGPSMDGSIVATTAVVANSDSVPAVQNVGEGGFDLDAVVSSIEVPVNAQNPAIVPVDLSKIKVARAVPPPAETTAKPTKSSKVPANSARIWVQIATGEQSAVASDYNRVSEKNAALFSGYSGWTSPWSKSSRLLVGPFDTMKEAKQWDADFRKSGGNGFVWQSAEGMAVTPLGGSAPIKSAAKRVEKQPTKLSTKQSAKQPAKPAGKSTGKDTAKKTSTAAAKQPSKTAEKQPAKTSSKQTAKQPAKQATKQPVKEATKKPAPAATKKKAK